MEENKEEKIELNEERLKELVAKGINNIIENGIQVDEIDKLGKLVDIHKDMANEDYWNTKKEAIEMRYYDNYDRDDYRDNYDRENYGRRRRDSRGRYTHHGEEMMNSIYGASEPLA